MTLDDVAPLVAEAVKAAVAEIPAPVNGADGKDAPPVESADIVKAILSLPEIIDEGVTGIVVETMEDAIAALPRVVALDRQKVRQRFERRFSSTRMAEDYVDLYRTLLHKSKSASEFGRLLPLQTDDTVAEKLGLHLA